MNLEEELGREHSKTQSETIAAWIGDRQKRFDALMKILMGDDETLARRASWAMCFSLDLYPQLGEKHVGSLVNILDDKSSHGALRRHAARTLQTLPLPEDLMARIFDSSLAAMADPNEPIAVRAYSMTTLARICESFPELTDEAVFAIEQGKPYSAPALKVRSRMALHELEKARKRTS